MIICIFHNDYWYFHNFGDYRESLGNFALQLIIPCPKEKHSKQQVQKKFVCRSKC